MKKAKDGATKRLRIASCLCLVFMIVEFVGKFFRFTFNPRNIDINEACPYPPCLHLVGSYITTLFALSK